MSALKGLFPAHQKEKRKEEKKMTYGDQINLNMKGKGLNANNKKFTI